MADTTYTVAVETSSAQRNLDTLNTRVKSLSDTFGKLRSAVAGIAFGALIQNANSFALAMDQVARSTGVSLDTINGFSNAIGSLGGNSTKAVSDIQDFVAGLYDAKNGSAGAQAELSKVGISLQDLATLSNEDIFKKTVDGLSKIESSTIRNSLAVKMLGKNFKDLDVRSVSEAMGTGGGGASTGAITAAADAQKALAKNINNFTNALINALQPLNTFIANINVSTAAITRFFDYLKSGIEWAIIVAGLTVVGRGLYILGAAARAAYVAVVEVAGGFMGLIKALMNPMTRSSLMANLAELAGGLGQKINVVLQAMGFNTAWMAKNWLLLTAAVGGAIGVIKEYLGLTDKQTNFLPQDEVDREMKVLQARQAMTQATEKVIDANRGVRLELEKQVALYQQSGVELKRKLQFENSLIGTSDAQKIKMQALFDVESDYLKQVTDLKQKYLDLQTAAANGTDEEKSKFAAFASVFPDALKKINQEYNNQIQTVSKLTDETLKLTQAEKLRVFGLEQQNGLVRELASLQDQIATTLLPELEKRYYAVEAAAKASALAQIQAEEIRMGRKLSPDEAQAYYDTASRGVDQLKQKQQELLNVQEQLNLRTFGIQQQNKMTEQMIDLNDQLATMTMPTLEKKYYDIEKAAKASARAEIQAAEARLGRTLSAEEAQKYYDAASKGTAELKQKTQELYESSRTFETGWKQAFNTYIEDATNAASRAGDIFNAMTSNMNSALDRFVETGKFSFKDLANSIIKDILKIELKAAAANLFKALGAGFGGGGGLFGGAIIPGFLADGGQATAGKPYVVGEEGPELFVPKGSGTVVPNDMMGASSQPVVYNITNNVSAVDGQSVARLFANNRQLMLGTIEQARKELPIRQGRR